MASSLPPLARVASLAAAVAVAGVLAGVGPLAPSQQSGPASKAADSLIPKVKPATPNDLDFRPGALRLVTALLGSLLVVAGGSALLGHFAPDWAAANLPGGPWLGLWGVLAAVGGWLQWKRAEPSADDA